MIDGVVISKQEEEIRRDAIEDEKRADDDLWMFLHSTLLRIVDHQKLKQQSGGDGYFKGEFDINSAADHLEIALVARAEFMSERASNDKSG